MPARSHLREAEREESRPDQPTDLPRRAWPGVLKRTLREYKADNLGDLAAALTYYGVLAIFPMLIVVVSLLGLLGHSVTQSLITNLGKAAPSDARQIFTKAIQNIQSHRSTAGVLFIVGLVAALWSASSYIAAFMRASNVVWDVEEGRPIWTTIPLRLGVTLITVILLTITARRRRVHGRPSRPARERDRGRSLGSHYLGHRQVASAAAGGRVHPGDPVLGVAERAPAGVPVGDPRRTDRRRPVGTRLRRVRVLRRELLVLQQDLRRDGLGDHLPRLAVDHQHRHPARRRAQRRDRARAPDRGRRARRSRAVSAGAPRAEVADKRHETERGNRCRK